MYFDSSLSEECRGCTACMAACPVSAIDMHESEGFLYPVIDKSKCINCGLCRLICDKTINSTVKSEYKSVWYGWNQDKDIRLKSTSGGAFPAIVDMYLSIHPDAWIYGAIYDNNFRVIHIGTQKRNEIDKMCRSKYLQSDMHNVYSDILEKLKNGQYVLFSGTPCQVAGIKALAGKYDSHLFTVDFICHGVSNPDYFNRYLRSLEKRKNSKVVSYSFRNKYKSLFLSSYRLVHLEFENGKNYYTDKDYYTISYKLKLFYRDSCYECKFAKSDRCSDITLGDFWGIENEISELKKQRLYGLSMILLNSEKAQSIKHQLDKYIIMHEYYGDFSKYSYLFSQTKKPSISVYHYNPEEDFIDYIKTIVTKKQVFKYRHRKLTRKLQSLKRLLKK